MNYKQWQKVHAGGRNIPGGELLRDQNYLVSAG